MVALGVSAALAVLGCASFGRSWSWHFPVHRQFHVALAFAEGNVRVACARAAFIASNHDENPLEWYATLLRAPDATFGTRIALLGYRLRSWNHAGARISELRSDCTLFGPLVLVFLALVVTRMRPLPSARILARETMVGSDSTALSSRLFRRAAMSILGVCTLAGVAAFAASYPDRKEILDYGDFGQILSPSSPHERVGRAISISAARGTIYVALLSPVDQETSVPYQHVRFLGMEWHQQAIVITHSPDPGIPAPRFCALDVPLWQPVALFGAWPFVAFVRGPLRRARRRCQGLCVRCGYNLTGLTEPRCPECGTAFDHLANPA